MQGTGGIDADKFKPGHSCPVRYHCAEGFAISNNAVNLTVQPLIAKSEVNNPGGAATALSISLRQAARPPVHWQ